LLDGNDSLCGTDYNYVYVPKQEHLSRCAEKIVAYIAGYVSKVSKNDYSVQSN